MADPLSMVAAVCGVADFCFRIFTGMTRLVEAPGHQRRAIERLDSLQRMVDQWNAFPLRHLDAGFVRTISREMKIIEKDMAILRRDLVRHGAPRTKTIIRASWNYKRVDEIRGRLSELQEDFQRILSLAHVAYVVMFASSISCMIATKLRTATNTHGLLQSARRSARVWAFCRRPSSG